MPHENHVTPRWIPAADRCQDIVIRPLLLTKANWMKGLGQGLGRSDGHFCHFLSSFCWKDERAWTSDRPIVQPGDPGHIGTECLVHTGGSLIPGECLESLWQRHQASTTWWGRSLLDCLLVNTCECNDLVAEEVEPHGDKACR